MVVGGDTSIMMLIPLRLNLYFSAENCILYFYSGMMWNATINNCMDDYTEYRSVIRLLIENAEQFNPRVVARPEEQSSAGSLRGWNAICEGRSLLSRPNYAIELYDTDMNSLFWILMNLFASENGEASDAGEKHALFTLRDQMMYERVKKGLTKLGIDYAAYDNDRTKDGYFDADIDVNNLSPFPGNKSIRGGVR